MQCTFSLMDAEAARTICSWRYDEQYAVYNIGGANEEDVPAEMLKKSSESSRSSRSSGYIIDVEGESPILLDLAGIACYSHHT